MAGFPKDFPRRGEIYWAPADKVRPVLVVSNDTGNKFSDYVMVAPITSTIPDRKYPINVDLTAGDPLPGAGVVSCGSIFTLRKDKLTGYRTDLSAEQMLEVDAALRAALALK